MKELFFESPWWFPVAFLLAGIAVFWSGNVQQQRKVLLGGLALILAGVGVALLSYFIQTDREKSVARVRNLVSSVNQRAWKTFKAQLDPNTNLLMFKGPDQITDVARNATEKYNIGSTSITGLETDQTDTLITVTVRVFTQGAGPGISDWQFQFQDFGHGFELRAIKALANESFNQERIRAALAR